MTALAHGDVPAEGLEADLWHFAEFMVAIPSPAGSERELAERLAEEGRKRCEGLTWWVDPVPGAASSDRQVSTRANLVVSGGAAAYAELDVVLLAHLDTSCRSGDEIEILTGIPGPRGPVAGDLVLDDRLAEGSGLGIAKGPAAAAIAALAELARRGELRSSTAVLLTCGGTHRVDPRSGDEDYACGLRHARDRGLAPRVVINVKAGAPGVLHEEPGSVALRITVRAPGGPTMARTEDAGGAVVAIAPVITVVEQWRRALLEMPRQGQTGREVGLGALRAGLCDKADLLPSSGTLDVYLVVTPDDDVTAFVTDLRVRLERDPELRRHGAVAEVEVVATLPAGRTSPEHPVVRLAHELWRRHFDEPPAIEDWKGSTDGALCRSWGIPVVRLGPRPRPASPGREALDRRELETFARLHGELVTALTSSILSDSDEAES